MLRIGHWVAVSLVLPIGSATVLAQAITVAGRLGSPGGDTVGRRYTQTYAIESGPADSPRNVLVASTEFDVYLVVVAPNGRVLVDDDGGGSRNARLTLSSARGGEWLVVVTSFAPLVSGRFTVTVDGPPPPTLAAGRSLPSAAVERIRMLRGVLRDSATVVARPPVVRGPPVRERPSPIARPPTAERPPAAALPPTIARPPATALPPGSEGPQPAPVTRGARIPIFPWPPPQASATADVPLRLLQRPDRSLRQMSDVNDVLEMALEADGYSERSYYSIPRGFALVTRLEQTDAAGHPLPGSRRWATAPGPASEFNIARYIEALLRGTPGHFRVIVFGVTAEPFSQTATPVTRQEALSWLSRGLNSLPELIGNQPIDDRLRITVLVYEFELSDVGGPPTLATPGRLSGADHLMASGILAQLQR